jgi:hypothetical protein
MVDKWDEASRKGNEIPIRPVDDESGPKILGMPAKTVVRFIGGPDGQPQIAIPSQPDSRWGMVVLTLALVFAWLFGIMSQALFHIV